MIYTCCLQFFSVKVIRNDVQQLMFNDVGPYMLNACHFHSVDRLASQQDEEDEEDFSALDEPLPECTLAFTHGIGKQVTRRNK